MPEEQIKTPDTEHNTAYAETAAATRDGFVQIGRDGGTGRAEHSDFRAAYKSVSPTDRRRAFIMLGAAFVTLAAIGLSRLLWLMKPVFDQAYYGMLAEVIYYCLLTVLYPAYLFALNRFVKSKCQVRIFRVRHNNVGMVRAAGCIAVAALAVFVIGMSFGFAGTPFKFTLKLEKEMGMGVTGVNMLINISVCYYYALHLLMGMTAAALVQYACSILLPTRYTVPWGSVFLVAVYALSELIFETFTTTHMFPWVYFVYSFAYAAIFTLSGRSFHISYWASVIILIL